RLRDLHHRSALIGGTSDSAQAVWPENFGDDRMGVLGIDGRLDVRLSLNEEAGHADDLSPGTGPITALPDRACHSFPNAREVETFRFASRPAREEEHRGGHERARAGKVCFCS